MKAPHVPTPPLSSPVLSDEVFDVLVGVLAVAPEDTASDDVLASLRALKAARPHLPELSIALAQRYLLANNLAYAREVLESADRLKPRHPLIGALLAFTLQAVKDPAWRPLAYELERSPHDELSDRILTSMQQ
jgi:type III secretion protein HrpB1